jgi:Uncharacterized protein conserved in bacteria (DUF2330)
MSSGASTVCSHGSRICSLLIAGPALACGGLVAPQGGIDLVRTSTLAAYHDGIEHYITSFEFTGKGGGRFGSIVPLPGVPTDVVKGGDWTLERLFLEVQPPAPVADAFALSAESGADLDRAKVLMQTRVEALKITVLEGGGDEVGEWAKEHGFLLPPNAPEVLDFYADRSPIFMAVRFDLEEAEERDLETGDGTPVHVTIPTPNPWVPLRILGLGKAPSEKIDADVYLLTDREPALLPQAGADSGMSLELSAPASDDLLRDLRSDRGMKWLPSSDMWLSYLSIDTDAATLDHDLAIDQTGAGTPSPVAAGLVLASDSESLPTPTTETQWWHWGLAAGLAGTILFASSRILRTKP